MKSDQRYDQLSQRGRAGEPQGCEPFQECQHDRQSRGCHNYQFTNVATTEIAGVAQVADSTGNRNMNERCGYASGQYGATEKPEQSRQSRVVAQIPHAIDSLESRGPGLLYFTTIRFYGLQRGTPEIEKR